MLKKTKLLLASLGAVLTMTACEDVFEGGSLQPDGSKPSLNVKNPTNNQTLTATGGLRVNLTATDKDKVKELQVSVRDAGGETELINYTSYPDKKILEVDTVLSVAGISPGDYKLTIQVTDHRTNVTSEDVNFKVK